MRALRDVLSFVVLVAAMFVATVARAEPPLSDASILGAKDDDFRIVSVQSRVTSYEQDGHGYQSQAAPFGMPGSERLTVLQPQVEVVAKQGERITHRIWLPVDMITAASPDAIDNTPASVDIMTGASRHAVAASLDWTTTYKADDRTEIFVRDGFHLEENFRSYNGGLGYARSFADGNTTLSASAHEVFDWYDRFDITGHRHGRAIRNTANGNVGVTQLLSPTTIVHADYGLTLQRGDLGNTWNAVPLTTGDWGDERLPTTRLRHALSGRFAQFLPWNGALKGSYRFYADDWGITAHTLEAQLYQRILPTLYLRANYRFHTQTGADFFTTSAPADAPLRTADSDLQGLDSHTVGLRVSLALKDRRLRDLHVDAGYERYWRTNDLKVNIVTWSIGFRF